MRDLKVGDVVEIDNDASYAFGVCQNAYMENCHNENLGELTVVAIGLQVMKKAKLSYRERFCDTLVTNGKGDYWFVWSNLVDLISPIHHTISVDGGKEVELSDESYENLRKQLL